MSDTTEVTPIDNSRRNALIVGMALAAILAAFMLFQLGNRDNPPVQQYHQIDYSYLGCQGVQARLQRQAGYYPEPLQKITQELNWAMANCK